MDTEQTLRDDITEHSLREELEFCCIPVPSPA
jgi:hypothetical protein